VPDGVLLAFQSYAQKEAVLKFWKECGVYEEIQKHKPVFEEAPNNFEMARMMTRYNDAVMQAPTPMRPTGGALLVAVCRGKLCEGIDFTDRQCRLVIMVGIPYPQKQDLRVMLKQDFLDARGTQGDGKKWYVREAIRAVNQTVGRVIRHSGDFGAVLLCDHRYASGNRLAHLTTRLPSWLRTELSVLSDFEAAVANCRHFFTGHGSAMPVQRPRSTEAGNVRKTEGTPEDAKTPSNGTSATPAVAHGAQQQLQQTATAQATTPRMKSLPAGVSGMLQNQSVGLNFRALGSFMRQQKAAVKDNHDGIANHASQSSTAARANGAVPVKTSAANLQVSAATAPVQCSVLSALQKSKQSLRGTPTAGRTPRPFVQPPKWSGLDKWLKVAEGLLPSMEFEAMKEKLTTLQQQAELVMVNTEVGCEVEQSLQASIRSVANALLPAFNFDSEAEKQTRKSLVREFSSLIPSLLRSLWRKGVDDLLRSQGNAPFAWKG
jgi:hypothetical protein